MFGFTKKKEPQKLENNQSGEIIDQKPEEILGLREYISVDSMKAHLVDILEENRELKADIEEMRSSSRKQSNEDRKKYELSSVTADEWKKRAKEAESKILKLKQDLDSADHVVENLKKRENSLITEAEMAKTALEKARKERQDAKECRNWLEAMLNSYGDWEKITKTQLVHILKEAIKAKDRKQEEPQLNHEECKQEG